jgi:hypothetical protein
MAGSLQVALTPVRTCAHPWGLRILTDANFIPLLRVMGFAHGIRSPDYFFAKNPADVTAGFFVPT